MRRRNLLRALALALLLALLPLEAARACSCGGGDPRDMLAEADGAFVGTFVERHLAEPPDPDEPLSSGADTIYTFTLDEEYKGELGEPGDTVEVHAPYSGASCGLEVEEGRRYGLFLRTRARDGAWTSGLCSQVSPAVMREAASPLPAPTGEGPVSMLVGGSFGRAQVMGLDSRGRTLAYGFGDRDVFHIDVCPGARRAVEIAQRYPEPPMLFVRDVNTFDTVRRMELPYGRGQLYPRHDPAALDCRSPSGRRVVVFSTAYDEPTARSLLLELNGRDRRVIHRGSGTTAAFVGGRAYLTSGRWGRALVRVYLRSGAERAAVRLPARHQTQLAVSPDGRRLAGIATPPWDEIESEPTTFYTIRLGAGRPTLRTRSLGRREIYAHPGWMSPRRPVVFAEYGASSRVFDLGLRSLATFGRWPARRPVVIDRTAFAPGYLGGFEGALFRVRLPDGAVRQARELPSPTAYAIVAVP